MNQSVHWDSKPRHLKTNSLHLLNFLHFQAGQPKMWLSSSGQMLQLETPGTRRAKELFDILQLLDNDHDVEGEDRLPALHAVAETVLRSFYFIWKLCFYITY